MKMMILLLLAMLMPLGLSAEAAFVTNPESGERVNFDGRVMQVYDQIVFESVKEDREYRSIQVDSALPPAQVLPLAVASLEESLTRGEITAFGFVGLENVLPKERIDALEDLQLHEKLAAIEEALGTMDRFTTAAPSGPLPEDVEAYGYEEALLRASLRSGHGYFLRDGEAVPYVTVALQLTYAPSGEYAGLSEAQRRYAENYTFTPAAGGDGSWGLHSIVRYTPDFFGLL